MGMPPPWRRNAATIPTCNKERRNALKLLLYGHGFHYEMENICRLFFHQERIEVEENSRTLPGPGSALVMREPGEGGDSLSAEVWLENFRERAEETAPCGAPPQELERRLAVLLFGLLSSARGIRPQWGILTGVRPVKFLRSLSEKYGEEEAARRFREDYLVSPEKLALSQATMAHEGPLLARSRGDSCSLYVSIPFCPTRCAYCSFVSSSVEKTVKLVPQYVELLCRELEHTAQVVRRCGLRVESVYFGGGTPTTLSAAQLARLLAVVRGEFDLSHSRELTVEAGRPDTITEEKLLALREGGVTRISINPQTLSDDVLRRIGRRHTTAQTLEAFRLARACGMDNINMDLIAGLPGDTAPGFRQTLDGVLALSPESITVHTLSLKRSAQIFQEGESREQEERGAAAMLDYAAARLTGAGYQPYYLYRQSRMVGNLENVGWCRPGRESPYNVYIMDETHTILACGAGASTKVKEPGTDCLERIFNFKYPYEYISRFQEVLARKDRVKEIYDTFGKSVHSLQQHTGGH